jgi:hypothetical protein
MTPGYGKPRSELPWLPYEEQDRVIINSHNFGSSYLYPSLRDTLPLAGYYAPLDTGAAASDQFSVDGSQDGTLQNGATRSNDGSGLAYSLTAASSQYITLPTQAAISGGNARTISLWFKLSSTTGSQYVYTMGTDIAGQIMGVRVNGAGGVGQVYLFINAYDCYTTTGLFSSGQWVHLAITYAGGALNPNLKVWINGSQRALTYLSGASSLSTANSTHEIGRTTGTAYFGGLINDVLLWNIDIGGTKIGYLASQRGAIYATA